MDTGIRTLVEMYLQVHREDACYELTSHRGPQLYNLVLIILSSGLPLLPRQLNDDVGLINARLSIFSSRCLPRSGSMVLIQGLRPH